MLGEIFTTMIANLSAYLKSKAPGTYEPITYGSISQLNEPGYESLKGKIVMGLVNIEEDRISRRPDNYVRTPDPVYKKSPVYLNLYVLFVANFDPANPATYTNSLDCIEGIVRYFQQQNVFTPANTPNLPTEVEELIFDLKTLSFQDMNNLWGVLGSKYLPSVLYKVRLVRIDDIFTSGAVPLIEQIYINEQNLETA